MHQLSFWSAAYISELEVKGKDSGAPSIEWPRWDFAEPWLLPDGRVIVRVPPGHYRIYPNLPFGDSERYRLMLERANPYSFQWERMTVQAWRKAHVPDRTDEREAEIAAIMEEVVKILRGEPCLT
jgi:hypothetical protein